MVFPAPSLIDRTKSWLRHLKEQSQLPLIRPKEKTGLFSNAQDFTINGGQFIDASNAKDIKINYVNAVVSGGQAVFEMLEPYACLDATKDSSARHPPPRCHPETRLKIRERLKHWLLNEDDTWKMLWVRGSAGTGKSAVAQSFGDSCPEEKHGGSYFFSRATLRNKPETVVPTLVYQLATTMPEYKSFVGHQLTNNPLLLRNSLPVQFRKLIVEPFANLQRQRPHGTIVIILDGLDECEGEEAQLEILNMITNALRTNPDLPLRWLTISRPESHLKDAFSKFTNCGREELAIDAECRDDVEKYTRDGVSQIRDKFSRITPPDWPPADLLQELIDRVAGLFVYASTSLNFIGDRDEANPVSRLLALLTFMRHSQGVVPSQSPLASLDLLYSRILEQISPTVFMTTSRILAFMSHRTKLDRYDRINSALTLCNFLRLDRCAFYNATRGLHSVLRIPEPEDAAESQLQFYHTSFHDFLLDPNRSGRFVSSEYTALVDVLKLFIYWYEVDAMKFHTHDGWSFDNEHKHDSLPGLTWAPEANGQSISRSITSLHPSFSSAVHMRWDGIDEDLLAQLSNVDFRFWEPIYVYVVAILCRLDPSTLVVRTEPSTVVDYRLLEYFNMVIGNGVARPAKFPLRFGSSDDKWVRGYFFTGHGDKSVIIWRTKSPSSDEEDINSLRADAEPSKAQISKYQGFLQEILWDEMEAKLKMK